jgi:serine/threonine-protein kinase
MTIIQNQLGPYHLHEEVSASGGVLVYFATDNRTQQRVLLYRLAAKEEREASLSQRFVAGVQAAMRLRHPHILGWQAYGEQDEHEYAVSEPLTALSLGDTLRYRPRPFSVQEVIGLVQQMAAALDFAALHGIAHHRLTPDEVWVNDDGCVLISGFGLPSSVFAVNVAAAVDQPDFTEFSAPEQISDGQPVDQRADVYGLCAICYTMLAGRPPFPTDDPALREQIIHQPPPSPDTWRPELSPALVAVLKYGLAKDPNSRYTTSGEFAQRLILVQGGEPPTVRTALTDPAARPPRRLPPPQRLRSRRGLIFVAPLVLIIVFAGVFVAGRPFNRDFSLQQTIVAAADQASAVAHSTQPSVAATIAQRPTTTPTPVQAATVASTAGAAQVDQPPSPTASMTPQPATASSSQSPAPGTFVRVAAAEPTIAASTSPTTALDSQVEPAAASPVSPQPTLAATVPAAPVRAAEAITIPSGQSVLTTTAPVDQAIAATLSVPATVPSTQANIYLPIVSQDIYIEGDVNQDANLRTGPGTNYSVVRGAFAGERFVLVACNRDCTWYQVSTGEWIAAFLVSNVTDPLQTLPRTTGATAP